MSRRRTPENLKLQPTYLRQWRESKKYKLKDLVPVLGIDATAISRLERGLTPFDQIHLQQLADHYQVQMWDLVTVDPQRIKLTEDLVRLVRRLDRADDVKAVRALVELLLSKR